MAETPGTGTVSNSMTGAPKRFGERLRAISTGFPAGLMVVVLALISCVATYLINSDLTPISPNGQVYYTTLTINVILIGVLMILVGYQILELWRERRRQAAGAGLHVRIVGLFTLVALIPALILAAFVSISLDRVLDGLFSARVTAIVNNSIDVANSYIEDQGQLVRVELRNLASQLETSPKLKEENPSAFKALFDATAKQLNLPVAYLLDRQGNHIAAYGDTTAFAQGPPPRLAFIAADNGRTAYVPPDITGGAVGALKKLDNFDNVYLYVIRTMRPEVMQHLNKAVENLHRFDQLAKDRTSVQFKFAFMYGSVTFTLLLASVWFGLWFAKWLVAPITTLIGAAQQVSEGNLDVKVDAGGGQRGDVSQLGATFNTMTADLRRQRHQLVSANAELEERRRFIEAVLSGVTAGVFGLDSSGVIRLANNSAIELLGLEENQLAGQRLEDVIPEFAALLEKQQGRKPVQENVTLVHGGTERNFSVRVTREREDKRGYGVVITFDDITELAVAQRTSAWADVARRIAHEIKNPLTPIQLSAERHPAQIWPARSPTTARFSTAAPTPSSAMSATSGAWWTSFPPSRACRSAVFEDHDVGELVREAVILFQMSHSEIDYSIEACPKARSLSRVRPRVD